MSAVKDLVGEAVDRLGDELESLSHRIHEHPELGYQEVKAAGWLSDFLERHGFKFRHVADGCGFVDAGSYRLKVCSARQLQRFRRNRGLFGWRNKPDVDVDL